MIAVSAAVYETEESDKQLVGNGAEKTLLYKDRFMDYLAEEQITPIVPEAFVYDELYCHTDVNGDTDWVLLYMRDYCGMSAPWIYGTIICNRVIRKDGWDYPFNTDFGLYDVKNDKFINVNNENMNGLNFRPADYPGFIKAFDEYASQTDGYEVNRLLGDLDTDGEISVIDVTIIQRCEAKFRDYPEDDEMVGLDYDSKIKPAYFSDFNRDGKRDILDATAIQRYLVNL